MTVKIVERTARGYCVREVSETQYRREEAMSDTAAYAIIIAGAIACFKIFAAFS
jgi:hypothetical protein